MITKKEEMYLLSHVSLGGNYHKISGVIIHINSLEKRGHESFGPMRKLIHLAQKT